MAEMHFSLQIHVILHVETILMIGDPKILNLSYKNDPNSFEKIIAVPLIFENIYFHGSYKTFYKDICRIFWDTL